MLPRRALWLLALGACRSAAPPPPPATGTETPAVTEASARATTRVEPPGALPFEAYRAAFVRELARVTRTRLVEEVPVPGAALEHEIVVLKRVGQAESFVVATAGFGRVSHDPRTGIHAELITYVDRYGPNIGAVLTRLGEQMHQRTADAPPWREYELVALPEDLYGLRHFDLRPAGEVDVPEDLRVVLLKAVPMSVEEFERAEKNPTGEWDDPTVNARMTQRWRRALEKR